MIRWHGIDERGFAPFCRILLDKYSSLNISMEEAMLIIHLMDYSWMGKNPFPSTRFFAEKTGKSEQTIRTYLRSLSYKGYLIPKLSGRDKTYDFTPLLVTVRSLVGIADPEPEPQNWYSGGSVSLECDGKETPTPPEGVSRLKGLIDASMKLAKDKSKGRTPVQTSPSHWKRLQSFLDKEPTHYNSKDMELVVAMEWQKKWKSPPPRFFGRDLKHVKELINIYSPEVVAEVLISCIRDWEKISSKFKINGYPSMPIFWGFRNSIFPMIIDGEIEDKPSWGSQYDTEKDSRPEGEEIGW